MFNFFGRLFGSTLESAPEKRIFDRELDTIRHLVIDAEEAGPKIERAGTGYIVRHPSGRTSPVPDDPEQML